MRDPHRPSVTGPVETPPRRRLVLLRHGQTASNLEHRIQGQLDIEIDDTGHGQAAAAAPHLAALQPVALWSSDLARARQTAAYVAKETGLEPTYDARLREYHLGERQGLTHSEYAAGFADEYAMFCSGDLGVVPGAESTQQVVDRMVDALSELLVGIDPGEVAMAVSHGAAIRVAVVALLGLGIAAAPALGGLDNCGWAILEESGDGSTLKLLAYDRVAPDDGAGFRFAEGLG